MEGRHVSGFAPRWHDNGNIRGVAHRHSSPVNYPGLSVSWTSCSVPASLKQRRSDRTGKDTPSNESPYLLAVSRDFQQGRAVLLEPGPRGVVRTRWVEA